MAVEDSNDDSSTLKFQRLEHLPSRTQLTALDPRTVPSTVHSRSSPNHHLPVELLAYILNIRFPDTGGRIKKDMEELYRLRLLSKSWKELIEGTPTLWTHISAHYPAAVVRDCLKWSKTHLLRIKILYMWGYPAEPLIELLQLLQPHSHRWKALDYHNKGGPYIDRKHSRHLLESPAPMLESIYVNLSSFLLEPRVNLAGGRAEGLKHLTLQDAFLPQYSNLLHDLETFSLTNMDAVPVGEILNIFVKSPALRRFELLVVAQRTKATQPSLPRTHWIQSPTHRRKLSFTLLILKSSPTSCLKSPCRAANTSSYRPNSRY
ncbi:glycoside hydrolase family 5 protein [Tulasnella calospora MUT 4182]|uniref:Glycoside hydrolase family 5 protein n=1 Tax=Tulasnella calospora MUT 4182 TaxID=1051891 RepID=A0A0C3QGC0_9AGAM|nr:glycoside hydrolase family 5 protein [Tulasnella calospora MUT 4182]